MILQYQYLHTRPELGLTAQLDDLLTQLDRLTAGGRQVVAARVYFSDLQNQADAYAAHDLSRRLDEGFVSQIEQSPLDGTKICVLVASAPAGSFCAEGTPERRVIREGRAVHLFQRGRLTPDEARGLSVEQQTERLFASHISWLQTWGLNLKDHCHRTWIYVRDIDHNYAGVVSGRNRVFAHEGLTADTHFIASTGIGGEGPNAEAAVCIDFYSTNAGESVQYLQALDYLNPTAEYGVAFERGTLLHLPEQAHGFISGTASIDRHGQILYPTSVELQTERLFLNISQLLLDGGMTLEDVAYFTVYLRDIADYAATARYMQQYYPHTPWFICLARVCRPGWLIEVECHATRPQ